MKLFKKKSDIGQYISFQKSNGHLVGFVPTMGALHEGHLALIRESREKGFITVSSIFVNPAQFNDKKDLEKYPRTVEKDIQLLIATGCDVLFLPDAEEIYPSSDTKRSQKHYDLGNLEHVFEGSSRPGHFQGVCQAVDRLFQIVQPDEVFFGQKDYQQCMVIQLLINQTDAFKKIRMNIVPTMREPGGLALSSRNMRLIEEEKLIAPALYQTLLFLKEHLHTGDLTELLTTAEARLKTAGFKPDYVALAHAHTLQPVKNWDGQTPLVALAAAFLGPVRLIDNLVLTH